MNPVVNSRQEPNGDRAVRILMIGPWPPPLGGTRVSFKQLVDRLANRPDANLVVLPIEPQNDAGRVGRILNAIKVLWRVFTACFRVDVLTLHASTRATLTLGPPIWMLGKLCRKPTILREFGGGFADDYARLSSFNRWLLMHTALSMDLLLFQTKAMVRFFQNECQAEVAWYSNSRPLPGPPASRKASDDVLNLVYVGHLKPDKGVLDLVAAVTELPDDCAVALAFYGPLQNGIEQSDLTTSRSRYCGSIPSEQIHATLATFDALVLPTRYPGEGYPGVLIEAFGAGLPVISTKWQAIPEIVDENNGILVDPGDITGLAAAIRYLAESPDELRRLSRGAIECVHRFDADLWANVFLDHAKRLTNK